MTIKEVEITCMTLRRKSSLNLNALVKDTCHVLTSDEHSGLSHVVQASRVNVARNMIKKIAVYKPTKVQNMVSVVVFYNNIVVYTVNLINTVDHTLLEEVKDMNMV